MVSIITPVFNSEQYLKKCIDSVLLQTFHNWELILIDDYSTDNSKEIIEQYLKIDDRIKAIFLEKNVGAGIARNIGIENSSERFIAFLDSDDYWAEEKLKMQLSFMVKNKSEFSFSYFYELNSEDKPIKIICPPEKINRNKLIFNNYIKTLTVIYDSQRIGKIFMPEYRRRQDWGLWFNLLEKTDCAHCLTEPLAFYRTSNNSLSKNKFELIAENYKFYVKFLKKNYLISLILMSVFLTVHLVYKKTGYKRIK